ANRESAYLAATAKSLRRAGVIRQQRTRLLKRVRPEALSDQHARRCDQPDAGALCRARFDGREHALAEELRRTARKTAQVLHRQGEPVCQLAQDGAWPESRPR